MRSPRSTSRTQGAQGRDGGLIRFLLLLALAAWALRSFVVAPFSIPTGSMLPTLYVGDYLFVAKWPYGYSRYSFPFGFPPFDGRILSNLPRRGDVAVFRPPGAKIDFIKRVIGLPGDTVEVKGGMLVLNGRPLPRRSMRPFAMPISPNSPCKVVPPASPFVASLGQGRSYCLYPAYRETLPGGPGYTVLDQVENPRADDFPAIKVPQGHVFLMGDNRDDSLDSRFALAEGGIGLVPVENLVGRALVTFWSTDGSASYVKPWTWFTALRGGRIGNGYTGEPE
ncbi:MAG TPA: signal peptidase I [Sphingomicrobium sp.]|nr:signal peptidase I [Sphingomicrobium sp.]